MRRLLALAAVVPILLVGSADAGDVPTKRYTPRDAARVAAKDSIAPLARPDTKQVTTRVQWCVPVGRWHACHVTVSGVTACSGVLRVRLVGDLTDYAAWSPRMRCR